jgi:hypothetical protein
MKTRIEFANNECGERLAKATVKTDGGRETFGFHSIIQARRFLTIFMARVS